MPHLLCWRCFVFQGDSDSGSPPIALLPLSLQQILYFLLASCRHLKIRQNYSQEDLMLTFGMNYPGALTLHNFPTTLMDLTKPNTVRVDLATIDILRDRERQVPRFNHYRRSINMVPYKSIDELTPDPVRSRKVMHPYTVYYSLLCFVFSVLYLV